MLYFRDPLSTFILETKIQGIIFQEKSLGNKSNTMFILGTNDANNPNFCVLVKIILNWKLRSFCKKDNMW